MSIEGLRYALTVPKLSSSERLLFIIIADTVRDGSCFASQQWFAKRTGLCIRTVRSALIGLEDKGHIKRETRYIGGKRTSDLLTANLPEKRKKLGAKSAARLVQKVPSNPSSPYGVGKEKKEGRPDQEKSGSARAVANLMVVGGTEA